MEMNTKISNLLYFRCGYCENNTKHMFHKASSKVVKFPANVVCMHHKIYGYILFDTGYSKLVYNNGVLSKLYNLANPTTFQEEDFIGHQLQRHHIAIEDIEHIIISHAHPDHIGALSSFQHATLHVSKQVQQALQSSNIKALVFKNMIRNCSKNYSVFQHATVDTFLSNYFENVYDIFRDQSLYVVSLEGHALGQVGLYIPEHKVLLAADSAWGVAYMDQMKHLKRIPRMIQANYQSYVKTAEAIQLFMQDHPEIEVIFSHTMLMEETYA